MERVLIITLILNLLLHGNSWLVINPKPKFWHGAALHRPHQLQHNHYPVAIDARSLPILYSSTSSSATRAVTIEEESPILLQADLENLSGEAAVAWIHAWCSAAVEEDDNIGSLGLASSSSSKSKIRPGLPATSLPVKASLTGLGARLVCQGLGPAFLDVEAYDKGGGVHHGDHQKAQLLVRRCLGEDHLARHSISIKGLAKDTERAILQKLKLDLTHTKVPGGVLGVTFSAGSNAGSSSYRGGISAPPPSPFPTKSAALLEEEKDVEDGEEEEPQLIDRPPKATKPQAEDVTDMSQEEEEEKPQSPMLFRELMDSLGLGDLGLTDEEILEDSEEEGDEKKGAKKGAWADPNSPFAHKAVEAYETFMKGQAQGQESVAGMKEVVMEEFRASSATPDDVKAMFEEGIRSAMREHDRVAEKGKKRRRILEVVKEVGTAKQQSSDVEGGAAAPASMNPKQKAKRGLEGGLVTLQMMFEGTGLKGGVDVLAGPPGEKAVNLPPLEETTGATAAFRLEEEEGEEVKDESYADEEEGEEVEYDEDEWDEAIGSMGGPDPLGDIGWDVAGRFELLVGELEAAPTDMFHSIASQYHNVFLSKHFIGLMRAQMEEADTQAKHAVLLRMVSFAEQLVIQLQEMSQLYEMQQLDKIKGLCEVAEKDMTKLSEYVAGRKIEFDGDFVKYLYYLIESEKGRLRNAGVERPEREPSNWLMILEIVKKGVYHELAKAIKDDVSMIHFITRFDEEDEREYLAREHIKRLAPSQVIPFKRVVTQMVDHFESRVNELTDQEMSLAGRVLHVEDILEDLHPDSSLLSLLQSPEGSVGSDTYKAGIDTLSHDPREWDHDAVEGLWDPEYLAAKYDRILKHYGFTASRQDGRGMFNEEEDRKEEKADRRNRLPREDASKRQGGGLPTSSSAPRPFLLEEEEAAAASNVEELVN